MRCKGCGEPIFQITGSSPPRLVWVSGLPWDPWCGDDNPVHHEPDYGVPALDDREALERWLA